VETTSCAEVLLYHQVRLSLSSCLVMQHTQLPFCGLVNSQRSTNIFLTSLLQTSFKAWRPHIPRLLQVTCQTQAGGGFIHGLQPAGKCYRPAF